MPRRAPVVVVVVVILLAINVFLVGASVVPALFVFGDSTLDTGNLNFRPNTVLFIGTRELPYGRDFVPPGPTGRASNGKLATDFLADFLGLPTPVDYLQPEARGGRMFQGLNFAAGGSGILNGTGITTITLSQQLDAFQRTVTFLNQRLGVEKASQLLGSSLFLLGTGNNDLFDYVYDPRVRFRYTPAEFNQLLLSTSARDIERLYSLGARRIVVLSVGPLGCTPLILNLFGSDGSCNQGINEQVMSMNSGLHSMLSELQSRLPGSNLLYGDTYDVMLNAIRSPGSYGFKYGNVACCGSGRFRGSILQTCNGQTEVCAAASEHVFWDVVHPTQAMYKLVTEALYKQLIKFL